MRLNGSLREQDEHPSPKGGDIPLAFPSHLRSHPPCTWGGVSWEQQGERARVKLAPGRSGAHHLQCWVPSRRLKTSFTTMGLSLMSWGLDLLPSARARQRRAGQTDPCPLQESLPTLALG